MSLHHEEHDIALDSSSWTGRYSTIHYGWRSPRQRPLFMIWRQWGTKPNGDVEYASVVWSTDRFMWRWQDHIRTLIKMVCGWDQSKCWVCRVPADVYPANPFKRAYCPEHCPEHDYIHERGEGWRCKICAEPAPHDFWAYND